MLFAGIGFFVKNKLFYVKHFGQFSNVKGYRVWGMGYIVGVLDTFRSL